MEKIIIMIGIFIFFGILASIGLCIIHPKLKKKVYTIRNTKECEDC
jgi:uncharacterized membrane protein